MTTNDNLREQIANALNEQWPNLLNDGVQNEVADAAISAVAPVLDEKDAESERANARASAHFRRGAEVMRERDQLRGLIDAALSVCRTWDTTHPGETRQIVTDIRCALALEAMTTNDELRDQIAAELAATWTGRTVTENDPLVFFPKDAREDASIAMDVFAPLLAERDTESERLKRIVADPAGVKQPVPGHSVADLMESWRRAAGQAANSEPRGMDRGADTDPVAEAGYDLWLARDEDAEDRREPPFDPYDPGEEVTQPTPDPQPGDTVRVTNSTAVVNEFGYSVEIIRRAGESTQDGA